MEAWLTWDLALPFQLSHFCFTSLLLVKESGFSPAFLRQEEMIPTWKLWYLTAHSALLEILELQLGTKFLWKAELRCHFANARQCWWKG